MVICNNTQKVTLGYKYRVSTHNIKYFEHLLNCNDPIETFTWTRIEPNLNECTTPSKQEVELQIRRLKNYKSPGEDGIQDEIMKMLNEDSLTHIYRLLTHIWEKEVLPEGWNFAVVCLIHKKGNPQICNNYRGIALLNVVYKILSYCILDKVKPIAEEINNRLGRTCMTEIRTTIEKNPIGKRPLGRPRLRWEDYLKRYAESVEPVVPWRVAAENRDRWREIGLALYTQW
ncbi:hypothetical protein AGLY_006854 [Aphis glycines]|uniref:Reverse transcriptase domain-containing protein n=1 Tax=Aphis glycines TaxID=307491 RepID=A0A6G0TPY2_APHGL|nr:hypothetical protein AGLY_006854 [Aphis glycines]